MKIRVKVVRVRVRVKTLLEQPLLKVGSLQG